MLSVVVDPPDRATVNMFESRATSPNAVIYQVSSTRLPQAMVPVVEMIELVHCLEVGIPIVYDIVTIGGSRRIEVSIVNVAVKHGSINSISKSRYVAVKSG